MGELKLIEFPEQKRIELYDLANDIGEANILAEQRPADSARLLAQLTAWKRELGLAPFARPAAPKAE